MLGAADRQLSSAEFQKQVIRDNYLSRQRRLIQ